MDLLFLQDDKHYFPNYEAVLVANQKFVEENAKVWMTLKSKLENSFSEEKMRKLNKAVDIDKESISDAASAYLETAPHATNTNLQSRILKRTKEHLLLVGVSLFFAILIGIPLGVAAFKSKFFGQVILFLAGVVQTIPSLALLCFLIPAFGIGIKPALIALFLYSLFPIILNTFTGLKTIDPSYIESANSLGLSWFQKLWYVEIPLVSPQILSGVKTSAIISIGTATLAALIGAGGYGAPIVSGLALNDMSTILIGAIPAAVMALAVHLIFDLLKYIFIPKGLRI
jgi:osmoprotectant transport system permease protein